MRFALVCFYKSMVHCATGEASHACPSLRFLPSFSSCAPFARRALRWPQARPASSALQQLGRACGRSMSASASGENGAGESRQALCLLLTLASLSYPVLSGPELFRDSRTPSSAVCLACAGAVSAGRQLPKAFDAAETQAHLYEWSVSLSPDLNRIPLELLLKLKACSDCSSLSAHKFLELQVGKGRILSAQSCCKRGSIHHQHVSGRFVLWVRH